MDKKFYIDTISLESKARIIRGERLKFTGALVASAGLLAVVMGEIMAKKASLKIHAVNNEAADLIEELDNIWLLQQK